MSLNLPSNVKQDPNTGLYIITNSSGKTFRVNASSQSQLDSYVNSVNTNTPVTITTTDPNTGDPRTRTFDPVAISAATSSVQNNQQLLTQTKRQTGIVGNADGTYTNLKTGESLTQEQASAAIQKAGLPPEALAAITPKNSPAYATATANADNVVNKPSNLPNSPAAESQQPPAGITQDNARISPISDPERQAFLDANAEPQTINKPDPVSPAADPQQQAFLDANAEPETISDPPFIDDQEADLLQTQQEEGEAISAGLEKPPTVDFDDYGYDSEEDDTDAVGTTDDANPSGNSRGLQGQIENARATATKQDQANYESLNDWRVILRLAEGSKYLYKNPAGPGILKPLADSKGVIFPYTPQIQVQYAANYDPTELTHSNYKIYTYKSSHVESISITCDFTAQDTYEANYLLAVIHFFRSVTKMFYGQDKFPKAGTPPPLCYLTGLGNYQFNNHPLAITGFNYTLPNDVDYIRAYAKNYNSGTSNLYYSTMGNSRSIRLSGTGVAPGGSPPPPTWVGDLSNDITEENPTYVPTKIQIQVQAIPIVSRLDISSRFSLEKYASGSLLLGDQNGKGGIW